MISEPRKVPRTILLVEDDALVRNCVRELLVCEKFTVLTANRAEEALDIWKEAERVDLLLTDLHMSGISGIELGNRVNQIDKTIPVLYMSGFPDLIAEAEGVPVNLFLQKPFTATELARKVRAAVNKPLQGWICADCGESRYRGRLADDNGHTQTLTFQCQDCGTNQLQIGEVLRQHSRCPFCSGLVLLAGYGYVAQKSTFYLESRCYDCRTKVIRHSANCPEFPRD